jgi:hypothetical protein
MSTNNEIKIKKLLDEHVPGTVILSSWLEELGISYELQKRYRKSGWIETIGTGAFKRPKENVDWKGVVFTLQKYTNLQIHPGSLTALSLLGYSHYMRLGKNKVFLFSPISKKLPAWFKNNSWDEPIEHIRTSMLPEDVGLMKYETKNFVINISSAERAMIEYLYLAPNKSDLLEGYQIFTGLTNLRPKLVQELLMKCSSIKVKRLFLYMAEKADHQWSKFLNHSKIDLGSGDRSIVSNGIYNASYKLTLPKELINL